MGRRELTTTVTMLALIGIVVLAAVWGWRALFAELPEPAVTADPSTTCTTEQLDRGQRIRAKQVRVSVFNGGTRSGLAGGTLESLQRRGFAAGDVGNAPADVDVRRVEVWSTVEEDPRARLVARQFGKKVRVRFSDEDLGPGIDVVVGDRFDGLVKAPRSLKVREDQAVCVPELPTDPDVIPEG